VQLWGRWVGQLWHMQPPRCRGLRLWMPALDACVPKGRIRIRKPRLGTRERRSRNKVSCVVSGRWRMACVLSEICASCVLTCSQTKRLVPMGASATTTPLRQCCIAVAAATTATMPGCPRRPHIGKAQVEFDRAACALMGSRVVRSS
jgi:hypothetical protein